MASCTGCSQENPTSMCPSRMADGRAFTDYRPRCAVNAELMQMVGGAGLMKSSYDSRIFLQRNAEKVIDQERTKAVERLIPCAPCKRSFNESDSIEAPTRYVVRCNNVTCDRVEVNPNGIGDGRNYSTH